jgi:hypothetical protein
MDLKDKRASSSVVVLLVPTIPLGEGNCSEWEGRMHSSKEKTSSVSALSMLGIEMLRDVSPTKEYMILEVGNEIAVHGQNRWLNETR